ncbi:hypothetical protein J3F84DRAFT_408127 [Trichoderma pleuroticola]
MANANSLPFLHAAESPYSTTVGPTRAPPRRDIYKAKQFADFILSMLLNPEQREIAISIARSHGLSRFRHIQAGVIDPDEVYSFGCVLAIAHFYKEMSSLNRGEIEEAFDKCVRAVNSLTYFLHASHDRTSRIPGPAYLDLAERWKLDRAWDICICLLGAIKARCGFQRKFQFTGVPIVQPPHYHRAVARALEECSLNPERLICPKGLKLLTRKEIAPFIQLRDLYEELNIAQQNENWFIHRECTVENCKFDSGNHHLANLNYHVPSCDKLCGTLRPPNDTIPEFNEIAQRGMPAVSVNAGSNHHNEWWVMADNETLAVSHVWRDGVHGTRNDGLNICVHKLLVQIARSKNCKSYWIDCAVIPTEEEMRRLMIERINKTFHHARVVLCWDKGFTTVPRDIKTMLLSLIVSPWHRRAWTLLEGNRASFSRMCFLQWVQNDFDLFFLEEKVLSAFLPETNVPLWIQSALIELLPYSDSKMSIEAAGLLLTGRHATRPGDSETIWGLLRPVEAIADVTDLAFDDPYFYAGGKADVAFISFNASRVQTLYHSRCWRPGKTDANEWVRTAYGGIDAVIEAYGDTRRLSCHWWMKQGDDLRKDVNWDSPLGNDALKILPKLRDTMPYTLFGLICPILKGDPRKPNEAPSGFTIGPVQGMFRSDIFMECSRAIVVTKGENDDYWQWQTIVELKESLIFTTQEERYITICCKSFD